MAAILAVPPRRYVLLAFIAFAGFLFLYQTYRYVGDPQRLPASTSNPPVNGEDGHSPWNHRPIHFPLNHLTPLPSGRSKRLPSVQHSFGKESTEEQRVRLERRQQIKDNFTKCWQSYRSRAWLRDELSPVSGSGRDTFGGWAATLVDALDTLWIMDLKAEFYEAAEAATKIDFSKSTDDTVNIFETTIRYLGGFLAAYDLSGEKKLLDKAIEVGEMLLVAFDTPNHMPITRWEWEKAARGDRQEAPSGMLVSELGSLSLEFTHLSQLTGDMRWYDAIQRIANLFDAQQSLTKVPGLWPVVVNPKDEDLTKDNGFTFGGMSDSLYEYFPKEFALLGGLVPIYRKMYEHSIAAAVEHLFFRPMTPTNEDILMCGDARASDAGSSVVLEPKNQHLTCFVGGMLALGGRLFSNEEHVTMGQKFTDGCIWAYKNGPRGLMPEIAHFVPCSSTEDCSWSRDRWTAAIIEQNEGSAVNRNVEQMITEGKLPEGFTKMDDRRYILRPEALESVFIMYRISGNESYREAGWEMFTAIQDVTATQYANAAINDITAVGADGLPPKQDRMESFWLAETLKYVYLLYSEPNLISLDDYVMNTEAHPFKRPV